MTADPEAGHRITEPMLISAIANEFGLLQDDIKIKSFDVSGGSAKGDNYACVMKALEVVAEIKGKETRLNYIAKCLPMNQIRADLMTNTGFFSTEVTVYDSLLPRLKNLEKSCSTNPNFPKHFYANNDEGVIIMENMKLKGYYMADKTGLKLTEVKLVLQQLARLHATSYHLLQTFPGGMDAFRSQYEHFARESWMVEGSEEMEKLTNDMFDGFYNNFVSVVKEFWTGDPKVIKQLTAFNSTRMSRVNAMHKPVEQGKGINCILHCDSWCNNFFFRNNPDGVASEAVILDLQLMKWGRPCVDIAYMIGTSTTPDFRKEHLEEVLGYYYKELSRVLLLHGYDSATAYPFKMFRDEFDECYVIAFVMGTMAAEIFLFPPDPDTFLNPEKDKEQERKLEEKKMETIRADPVLKSRFINMVTEALSMGILAAA